MQPKKDRVQKILASYGVASRRKCELLIASGKVEVNNVQAVLGQVASYQDEFKVNGQFIRKDQSNDKVYILLNKPAGYICTRHDPQGRPTILDLVKVDQAIFPIGRLDYNTTGTILLTNDGELTHRLIHPSFEIKRVYRARLDKPLSVDDLKFLNSSNVYVDDKISKQVVTQADAKSYIITLHVGTFHHVKRLFELVNCQVVSLTRIEFAGITHVNNLMQGQWRYLKPKEIKWLKTLTSLPN